MTNLPIPHDNTYIGSHDIARVVLPEPIYGRSKMDTYLILKGLKKPDPPSAIMRRGLRMERVILEEYTDERNLSFDQLVLQPHRRHSKHDFFGSTLDAIVMSKKGLGVDAKNVTFMKHLWGEAGTDEIPDHILIGMQWHMLMHGLDHIDVAALLGGFEYREYPVERDEEMIRLLMYAGEEFWKRYIVGDEVPEMDATDASKEWLKIAHPKQTKGMRAATAGEIRLIEGAHLGRDVLKKGKETKDELENKLKKAIGDHEGIELGEWRATYKKNKDERKTKYDLAYFELGRRLGIQANTLSKLLEEYTTTKPGSRVLRITKKGS